MQMTEKRQRLELTGNYPFFAVVIVIYNYVERIWRNIVIPGVYTTYGIVEMLIQVNKIYYIQS